MTNRKSRNILVFNVNWVGDVIFSTPVFRSLKEKYPQARISCLAVPRVREVLESCSAIDEVIIFDEKGRHRNLWGKWQLIKELRRRHFDVVFLLHRSWSRALLVYLSAIPQRVGYNTKHRGWLLTHRVTPCLDRPHRCDYYLQVVESVEGEVTDRTCRLDVNPLVRDRIHFVLQEMGISPNDPLVVINPGGNWDLKRWPAQQYALLVKRLKEECQVHIALTGARKDISLVDEITRLAQVPTINLAGKTDLKELLAVMQRARVVVSADSGPLHMASGVGTPSVAIFGPTSPAVTGPRGPGRTVILRKEVGCNQDPCYFLECPDNRCMKAICADDVLMAVKEILKTE